MKFDNILIFNYITTQLRKQSGLQMKFESLEALSFFSFITKLDLTWRAKLYFIREDFEGFLLHD